MEEKKFDVVVVFGADAVSEYVEAWDNNEQISEGRLEELGCVVRRSFKTEAEKKAYLLALEDADGWWENTVAEENHLKP